MTEPDRVIEIAGALAVASTGGGTVNDTEGVANYVIEFTGCRVQPDGTLNLAVEEKVTVVLDGQQSTNLIYNLVELVNKHDPNTLYDGGIVAAKVGVLPTETP